MASVDDYIETVTAYAEEVREYAESATDTLETLVNDASTDEYSFSDTLSLDIDKPSGASDIDVDDLTMATLDYDPSDISPDNYTSEKYSSDFFDFLSPILQDQIANGGVGISPAVQDALFNDGRERDLQTLDDALDAADANTGRRGFSLPSSLSENLREEVIAKYAQTRDNRNREITALIAERAQSGMMALIDKGLSIEQAQMSFTTSFAGMVLELGNQILNKYKLQQDVYLGKFESQVKKSLAKLDAAKVDQAADMSFNDTELREWSERVELTYKKTIGKIDQAVKYATLQVQAAESLVSYYATTVSSANEQINAVITASEDDD
jgi:hypothetical protein